MQKAPLDRLHFIGIGGTGMRPLAEIALAAGYSVSGSDQSASESTEYLSQQGARITIGHSALALPSQTSTVVLSSAIRPDNPEAIAAQQKGWPMIHRSDLLSALMEGKQSICVSGTHGKTSTTGMLAYMLHALHHDPSAAIGGELGELGRYALYGKGPWFVAECDESDGSFLKYDPFISIISNIDLDHLDFYKDINALKAAFQAFAAKTRSEGFAVFGWDNPYAREVAHEYKGQRLTFGTRIGSEVRGISFKSYGQLAHYEAVVHQKLVRGTVSLVGKHNFQNVLCCLAVAHILELDLEKAAAALRMFPGVRRRFSLVGEVGPYKIFDDYAHNPGKIRSCLEGAREAFANQRILVIFQPHRYSRLETMYNELMGSFAAADEVHVMPVYAAGETSVREFTPMSLAQDMSKASGVRAYPYDGREFGRRLLSSEEPTVLITVGAGDVWQLSLEWKDFLHEQASQKKGTSR